MQELSKHLLSKISQSTSRTKSPAGDSSSITNFRIDDVAVQ
jgi:hypothetical protein